MRLFWLSFCDPDKLAGSQFLGVVILEVPEEVDWLTHSHQQGLNPGGEIAFLEIPQHAWGNVPAESRNRLLTRAEAEAL